MGSAGLKIAVAGLGYVGLANAVMFAEKHQVVGYDIDEEKIAQIGAKNFSIDDQELSDRLQNRNLDLRATSNAEDAFSGADFVIVATPTDFDEALGHFNTRSTEEVIALIEKHYPQAVIALRSTLPIGFSQKQNTKYGINHILSAPEFLREGSALSDCLNPSRIVVGGELVQAEKFAKLMLDCCESNSGGIHIMANSEAEAVKLFSNGYLAMRVAYFNELDSFAMAHNLDAGAIVNAVSEDPRIGMYHNNPSFGYGGYCLPKDTKQLASSFDLVPQSLLGAIVDANEKRKSFVAEIVREMKPDVVGIYRLLTKAKGDNFRDSAILDILEILKSQSQKLVIYEPLLSDSHFHGVPLESDLQDFKERCDLVLANRIDAKMEDIPDKLFSRDIFHRD